MSIKTVGRCRGEGLDSLFTTDLPTSACKRHFRRVHSAGREEGARRYIITIIWEGGNLVNNAYDVLVPTDEVNRQPNIMPTMGCL